MAKSVYETAERIGFDPCLVFNILDRESQARLSAPIRAFRTNSAEGIEHGTVDGLEAKGVPLILPEIEFTQYVLNGAGWRSATGDGDAFFAVSGTNQCSIPFLRQGKPFGSWTATLLWEDRVDRLKYAPLIERVRDHLSRPVLQRLEREAFEAADPAIVLSKYTADRLYEKYEIEADEVIPYPIDTNRFSVDETDKDPFSESPTILFVGRFNDPRKNTPMLVDAFSRVRASIPDVELWLIGAEPDVRVRERISEHGLNEAVVCRDRIPNEELPRYYRNADLFAIPSNQEGLAIVGLESMSCGTPVVATRCGGPEQYVVDGETGYLVPKDDPTSMADHIIRILSDNDLKTRLSQNSKDLVREEYSVSKIQERIQRVLQGVYEED